MKILSVKISNILSIEDAFVEFSDSGLMLVQGWNHDVGRAYGAGKTAIFNSIAFSLFDKLPRKITATEILRRGSKSGYVECEVEVKGDRFTVKRSRPKGVTFHRNGSPQVISQEEFESHIGMNYNQFIISMYCAQGTQSRFLSLNDADKKQFLLQLLNLEEFSACRLVAEQKVKNLNQELEVLKSKEAAILSKIDAYSESLIDETICAQSIDIANQSIVELETALREQKLTTKPDFSKFEVLENNILAKRTEFTRAKTKREMLHDQYRKLSATIKPFNGALSCRECGAPVDHSAAQAAHNKLCDTNKVALAEIKGQIDECDDILSKESQVNDLAAKIATKKKEEAKEYDLASSQVRDIQTKLTLRQRELKELTLKLQSNSELLSKIQVLNTSLEDMLNRKGSILSDIDLYKTVSAMYSPTGAQAYILDSVIDSFNECIKFYVDILWSNFSYSLQSYKENLKGEVSARFSEQLVADGKPVSIGSLSGGELRALSLCVDFALVDVMERQFGISMSPITLDEPFDGLDALGREIIVELLESISEKRQVVVIDHASEIKSMFSTVLNVEKRNGVSTVKLET